MIKSFFFKYIRRFKRWAKKNKKLSALLVSLIALLFLYAYYMNVRRVSVEPSSYKPLMNLIASAESNGNYNAYFGNAQNSQIDFTNMSISEVLDWQADYVANGSPSSAVGRYQIINTTLSRLISEQGINKATKFNEATQDQMAIALFEHRGSIDYVNNQLTKKELAANLAKEWAALPKAIGANPDNSYYAGDGLNKARLTTSEVLQAVDLIRPVDN